MFHVPFQIVPPRSIDASEALALPGVVDVITAEDIPGANNHQGEILYAQNEVCGLYGAYYSNACLENQNNYWLQL